MSIPKFKENPCSKNTNYYCKCGHCYTLHSINRRKMHYCYNCGRPISEKLLKEVKNKMIQERKALQNN